MSDIPNRTIATGGVLTRALTRDLKELSEYIENLEAEVARLRELEESVIQYAMQQNELEWADKPPKEIFDVLLALTDRDS